MFLVHGSKQLSATPGASSLRQRRQGQTRTGRLKIKVTRLDAESGDHINLLLKIEYLGVKLRCQDR